MRRPFALLLLAGTACADPAQGGEKVPLGTPAAAAAGMAVPGAAALAATEALTGTVLEQMPAGGYVYLRLRTANGEVWAAVNPVTVKTGDTVTIEGAILMERFESKTLNRTFDRIYFGTIGGGAGGAMAQGSGGAPGDAAGAMPGSGTPTTGTPPAVDAKVRAEKASGPDARTVGELWAQSAALTGKTVTIRGVVVKYNPGVMGKNWIHLQDGSGDATKGTHDIAVTSQDAATMGETMTIRGTVHTNRDFGGGYTYALIVEDAKVVKP